ncbi:MAG TPA: segregation/condensation protein A [Atopostipes sp.]|nr:segregation/condensation protein A [Atopostipes sp.]
MEEYIRPEEKLKLELEIFEGPLDLLLHLINQLEIDIYDIPIAQITDQYMRYLEHMKTKQIDVASEYFVMAATLMRIKSEMLVPRNENQADLEEDFYEEEDPRVPLMELLLEYKQIKEVVPKFEERHEDRADYFGKDPSNISQYRETIELKDQGLEVSDLAAIFSEVLQRHRIQTPQPTTIETDEITVVEKMNDIRLRILKTGNYRIKFSELLQRSTKKEIVVTFLAMLELIKDSRILVEQDSVQSDISISVIEQEKKINEEKQGSNE